MNTYLLEISLQPEKYVIQFFIKRPAYAELSATLRHRVEEAIHKTRLLEEGAAATTALRTEVDATHARLTEAAAARAAADARNAELMRRLEAMEAALAKAKDERVIAEQTAKTLQESLDAHIEKRRQEAERSQSHVRARTSKVDPDAVAKANAAVLDDVPSGTGPQRRKPRPSYLRNSAIDLVAINAANTAVSTPVAGSGSSGISKGP